MQTHEQFTFQKPDFVLQELLLLPSELEEVVVVLEVLLQRIEFALAAFVMLAIKLHFFIVFLLIRIVGILLHLELLQFLIDFLGFFVLFILHHFHWLAPLAVVVVGLLAVVLICSLW